MRTNAPEGAGDAWTFTAIDLDSKLIISYLMADRNFEATLSFMQDLRARTVGRIQLTTDGMLANEEAVEAAFLGDIDFAQVKKSLW